MFTIIGFIVASVFWLFDSVVHYFLYSEPSFEFIPDDFNGLWMRTVIIILLVSFVIFVDYFMKKLVIKEKELEKARIYSSMLYATHHILNNLLNQIQLIRLEAHRSKDFDKSMIKYYDNAILEASDLLDKLSNVEEITGESIWASVDPDNVDVSSYTVKEDDTKKHETD